MYRHLVSAGLLLESLHLAVADLAAHGVDKLPGPGPRARVTGGAALSPGAPLGQVTGGGAGGVGVTFKRESILSF